MAGTSVGLDLDLDHERALYYRRFLRIRSLSPAISRKKTYIGSMAFATIVGHDALSACSLQGVRRHGIYEPS